MPMDIAVDGSGNVYVTGWSQAMGFSPPSPGLRHDYATVKYNSSGVQQWVSYYNFSPHADSWAKGIAVDASGNVYVTGRSASAGSAAVDYATVKYNSSGVQQWASRYNGPANGDDTAHAITIDGSGNVFVTGESPGVGSGMDYATVKYNSSGAQQWVARYTTAGSATDMGADVALDGSGNVFVTGNTSSGTATVKYNSSGTQQWVASVNAQSIIYYGASPYRWYGKPLGLDGSGNVYVLGTTQIMGGTEFETRKYNTSGTQQWSATYVGPGGSNVAHALAVTTGGSAYVVGTSSGADIVSAAVKYNSSGVQQWAATYNAPGSTAMYNGDEGYCITADNSGHSYVGGHSRTVDAGVRKGWSMVIKYTD